MPLRSSFCCVLLLFGTALCTAADVPAYKAVPMQAYHEREGIGNALAKLNKGETVTIAYLGGSITAANGWRPKTTAWFKQEFPTATIKEMNAAIGGTGSDLGVFRLQRDVLKHKPDLLFVEFAVNDGGTPPEQIWKSMEGIVRQTWRDNPLTDIVFIYTISEALAADPRKGICCRSMSAMELLADFYGIPSINFAVPVLALEKEGKLLFKGGQAPEGVILFSQDGVHPVDSGHEVYCTALIEGIVAMKDSQPMNRQSKLDKSFMTGHWEQAKMIPITETMLQGEWKKPGASDKLQSSFGYRLGQIWTSDVPGSKLSFRFKGSQAKLYDLLGPNGGQVIITVDGQKREKPAALFDSYCTYHRLGILTLADGLNPDEVHEITVEIHPDQPDRQPVAVRLKEPEKELKEEKYQGTNVWFGQLMLLGELNQSP